MNKIDNKWENAIAFYYYKKKNPKKPYIYSKKKKLFFIKEKIIQINRNFFVFQTFYIDPRDYFK